MSSPLVLNVHAILGILVAACAALLVWFKLGRRITLYLLSLQILVGIVLIVGGRQAPSLHYSVAIVGWLGYMGANYMTRKPNSRKIVLLLTVLSSLLILFAAYLGSKAGGLA